MAARCRFGCWLHQSCQHGTWRQHQISMSTYGPQPKQPPTSLFPSNSTYRHFSASVKTNISSNKEKCISCWQATKNKKCFPEVLFAPRSLMCLWALYHIQDGPMFLHVNQGCHNHVTPLKAFTFSGSRTTRKFWTASQK